MLSKILKSEEEFESLKKMLIQDAETNGVEAFFDDESPMEYPCLAKIDELNNVHMNIEMDEDDDIEEILEEGDFEIGNAYIYDFLFIYQSELEELLEA